MAFVGNLLVTNRGFRSPMVSYALLLVTIVAGYVVAVGGGVAQADLSAKLTLVALLTGPLLFSGIMFSTLLKSVNDLPSALAYNLLGPCWGDCWNTIPWSLVLLSCTCPPSRCMGWRSPPHGCGRPARDDSVGCSRRTSASLRAVVPFNRHRSADADGQSGTPTSGGASHPMNGLFPIPTHP